MVYQEGGDTFLSVSEACEHLHISRQALDRYVERGLIKKYRRKLARRIFFKQSELDRLAEIRPDEEEGRH